MIHYHGSPCSGSVLDAATFFSCRHAMVSFAAPDQLPVIADVCQSFVLDNGAFSHWRKGGRVDWDSYVAWVNEWARHPAFDWCLIPDVIDGSERDNAELVRNWRTSARTYNVPAVPVWHFHESLDYLRHLAATWPRVALGSSGQWPTPGAESWWVRVSEFMSAICDEHGRPQCKLHGLRMLDPEIFTRLPLASADSTNAAVNAGSVSRFGTYVPPSAGARANVIASRIESYQSACRWVHGYEQAELFSLVG